MHLLSRSVGPRLYYEVREEIFRRWDAEAEAEEEEDVAEDEQIFEERLAALQGELTVLRGHCLVSPRQTWMSGAPSTRP